MPARPMKQFAAYLIALTGLLSSALGQEKHVAFPERDILSPFRTPTEVYAPPDRLFGLLRRMQAMATDGTHEVRYDELGREEVLDDSWRDLRNEVERIGLDAGYLASILRMSKNDSDRRTAFYAMFYCDRIDHILNLIAHIPGEPLRSIREEAFPRAIRYLRAHLGRRFGDLSEEEKAALLARLPEVGSPAAKARGILRAPRDGDALYQIRLTPFFQLLDVDAAVDQAQGLWFLKEVFSIRRDLAKVWLEPALPRIEQLLVGEDAEVRKQAIGLLRVIGPDDLPEIEPDAGREALLAWADRAERHMFPPIRNVNDARIELYPSPERDALAAAGLEALRSNAIGDPYRGKDATGKFLSGYRIVHVPEALAPLAIPEGAILTSVNGSPIFDAKGLLKLVEGLLTALPKPQTLLVEYVLDGKSAAVEYRIM